MLQKNKLSFCGGPFLWGPLFGWTWWTCLNPPLVVSGLRSRPTPGLTGSDESKSIFARPRTPRSGVDSLGLESKNNTCGRRLNSSRPKRQTRPTVGNRVGLRLLLSLLSANVVRSRWTLNSRVKWRHRVYGHDTIAILWIARYNAST